MKETVRCFISYCHENMDMTAVRCLKQFIEAESRNTLKVFIDEDLKVGENISEYMRLLFDVEIIIVLMTPSFKERVESRKGAVYEEYKMICHRFDRLREQMKRGPFEEDQSENFELIPILFSGSHEKSVPDEIDSLKYLNLVGFRPVKSDRKSMIIPRSTKLKYKSVIQEIVNKGQAILSLKSPDYIESLHNEYFPKLFRELKADWQSPREKEKSYINTLLVKTFSYRRVESQSVCFVIGRKGSGKSTVADAMSIRHRDRYTGHISIIADEFNLETPYATFNTVQMLSEMENYIPRYMCFEFAWEILFYLCAMEIILVMALEKRLTKTQRDTVSPIIEFMTDLRKTEFTELGALNPQGGLSKDVFSIPSDKKDRLLRMLHGQKDAYFNYAYRSIEQYVNYCIYSARSNGTLARFHYDIEARVKNFDGFLLYVFGQKVVDAFDSFMKSCKKRILVTLDGFDTAFDKFRTRSILTYKGEARQNRNIFETDWLGSFLSVVVKIRKSFENRPFFYDRIDFCITIPKDRFLEILRTERDSYVYDNRYCTLNWSGIELSILLRKRLEELGSYKTNKLLGPEERMIDVLKKKFSHIPINISFEFNHRKYQMPLFMYILRHTFWRPRDVLLYYANIIAMAKDMRKRRKIITADAIRKIIKDTTYVVIRDEFINEFKSTLINIQEIVERFNRCRQVLDFEEVCRIISDLHFKYASGPGRSAGLDSKIDYLYQIGFIGFEVNDQMRSKHSLKHNHAFYFNEGIAPIRGSDSSKYFNCRIIIHPIFCDYLQLDTSNNELVLVTTWEYLKEMESLLFQSSNSFLI